MTVDRAAWGRISRRLCKEIRDWDAANPQMREQYPPRFRYKTSDDVRARNN